MSKHTDHRSTHAQENPDLESLAEDAQALMTATADVAGDKVAETRQRLSEALAKVRDAVVKRAKSADKVVRENPYKTIGIALGVGVLIGWCLSRRSRDD